MSQANISLPPAVVVDASICVAVCAKEPTSPVVNAEINRLLNNGSEFYAPGVLVAETLYVLCGKAKDGSLSTTDHVQAVEEFAIMMSAYILPPPHGDASLVRRAEAIRAHYPCNRSADGLYIALAEALSLVRQTILLTLDKDMPKQASKSAPSVQVQLL